VRTLIPPPQWNAQQASDTDRFWRLTIDLEPLENENGEYDETTLMAYYGDMCDWARARDLALRMPNYEELEFYGHIRLALVSVRVDTQRSYAYSDGMLQTPVRDNGYWFGNDCERCSDPAEIGEDYCPSCNDERSDCGGCGYTHWTDHMQYNDNAGEYYCDNCYYDYQDEEEEYVDPDTEESTDPGAELTADGLGFEARMFNPDRGNQLTSVELEFGSDPEGVAQALYNNGMSPTSSVGGYHEQARRNRGSSYVEYDGSVGGGGELVISMIRLPEEQETLRLWHTVKVLRDRVHAGFNKLDMRCGCHIHVNALGRNLDSVISTVVAYNHIEDILYRMSAANYRHHRLDNGNDYCTTTEKEIVSKERFRASFGTRRYYGLNVGNYLSYRNDCQCGAGFEHADRCQCDESSFYKPTLEFRLFNTTANGAKLHAFIAACQSLVTYGTNRTLLSTDLEPMEYRSNGNPYSAAMYAERCLWMLTELPFSESERNSIRYCLRNSSIAPILNQGVADGDVSASDVQAILHEDALLEVQDYTVPERIEENLNTRANWRMTDEVDRDGMPLVVDMAGRYRRGATGRYATPVQELVGSTPYDPECSCISCTAYRENARAAAMPFVSFAQEFAVTEDIAF
jgi:hypothetical protein